MYTEEDTFNALKQTPFIRLFVMCVDHGVGLGDDILRNNLSLVISNGWTAEEFEQRVRDELIAGTISLDVTLVNSEKWRNNLLKGCEGR